MNFSFGSSDYESYIVSPGPSFQTAQHGSKEWEHLNFWVFAAVQNPQEEKQNSDTREGKNKKHDVEGSVTATEKEEYSSLSFSKRDLWVWDNSTTSFLIWLPLGPVSYQICFVRRMKKSHTPVTHFI